MIDSPLAGRSILIVEDQPIVAMDIASAFEDAGAMVTSAYNLGDAMQLAEGKDLSAAVVDFGLGDEVAEALFARLNARNIIYVLHSGYGNHGAAGNRGIVIPKPADPNTLVEAITSALCLRALAVSTLQSQQHGCAYDPERVVEMQQCFDDGWNMISGDFTRSEAAQTGLQFAKIICDLASEDRLDGGNLTLTAIHEMRRRRTASLDRYLEFRDRSGREQ